MGRHPRLASLALMYHAARSPRISELLSLLVLKGTEAGMGLGRCKKLITLVGWYCLASFAISVGILDVMAHVQLSLFGHHIRITQQPTPLHVICASTVLSALIHNDAALVMQSVTLVTPMNPGA